MLEFLQQTLAGFTAMSYWEYLAVLFGVAYIVLVTKESLWAWPCAFFNTLIYTILFFNGALLMESALNIYYLFMAFYGFYCWRYGSNEHRELAISSWGIKAHVLLIVITTVLSLVIGYLLDTYTRADYAYLDSLTSCFAVVTTYLVAKKVLENWLYWVVIDAVSIYLFLQKGYYPTVILFAVYTGIAVFGYLSWREHYNANQTE